jgi:uncharacterized protein YyaL (SSP411 family)
MLKCMNRLGKEKSPYLLQHAENPVDWYPWGSEAFAAARAGNKPIFLSIGYSTCYWCHVMEKECFEQADVAGALSDFVSIKVDREEHPEIDEIYMSAVMAMTGRGGWPMSVMLTPDLKPFWGGTYLPKEHFLALCAKVQEVWQGDPKQILQTGDQLSAALAQMDKGGEPVAGLPDQEIFRRFLIQANETFDPEEGGFSPAPKFPSTSVIRTLLRLSRFPSTFDQKHSALEMAEKSLEAMACGGIFDHLGGGFHRYSVDDRWLVPHFEKMLYDNGLCAVTYLEAYQLTGRELYAGVARETLDYILRDMKAPGGAFYAAEDAGPVGREGEFYVWKFAELESLPQFKPFFRHFSVIPEGNFEHGNNVLCLGEADDWEPSRSGEVKEARAELLSRRAKRARPHRDEKILTAWNGLALNALALGAAALNEPRYLAAAEECAAFIKAKLWNGKALYRRYAGGEAKYLGTASDYAFLIDGLIQLYQAGFREEHLLWAKELQGVLDAEFWDEKEGAYFTAARAEENLLVRKKDRHDGAIPSPNSVSYRNLLALAQYFAEPAYGERAAKVLAYIRPALEGMPFAVPEAGVGLYFHHRGENLVVLSGVSDEAVDSLRGFLPESLLARVSGKDSAIPALKGKGGGDPTVYLCQKGVCRPPAPFESGIGEFLSGLSS